MAHRLLATKSPKCAIPHGHNEFVTVRLDPLTNFKFSNTNSAAPFEAVKKRGDAAIKSWIDGQLVGTTVTCVLVGAETCQSKWVQYEIDASIARGNAMLGIDISKIKAFDGSTTDRCGKIPAGYPFHLWNTDDGPKNLGTWIDNAPV